jgi:hypothetical protein
LALLFCEAPGVASALSSKVSSRHARNRRPFLKSSADLDSGNGLQYRNRRINAYSVLKRMLLHNVPNSKELRILEIVLHQGIRKLREYNQLRKQTGLPAIDVSADSQNDEES